ncbi:MAG: hypothetical protein EXR91_08925 [Gemmatimonadetes bacterium]|nr:hypothetical protein [Gemmatimonadota bacterium]
MEQGSRTKLVAALVLASVFGSGILLGYAADRGAAGVVIASEAPAGAPAPTERGRRAPVYEQMNPTLEQRALIDSILRVHRDEMNRLHAEFDVVQEEYQDSYDAVIQDTRVSIAAVFPSEQAADYRRRLAEDDQRRAAERASKDRRK